jgi:tripeptidyl-peptidase-1
MFGRVKQHKSTARPGVVPVGLDALTVIAQFDSNAAGIDSGSGVTVNASCTKVITISCLQELYNAVGVVPSATNNSIAVTGYLVGINLNPTVVLS